MITVRTIEIQRVSSRYGADESQHHTAANFGEANATLQHIARTQPDSEVSITIMWIDGMVLGFKTKLVSPVVSIPNLRKMISKQLQFSDVEMDEFFAQYSIE